MDGYTDGKSGDDSRRSLIGVAQPGSPVYQRMEAEIAHREASATRRTMWLAAWIGCGGAVVVLAAALIR